MERVDLMRYAGMFKDCYVDQVWVGCSGDYSHGSRSMLLISIIIGTIIGYILFRKWWKSK